MSDDNWEEAGRRKAWIGTGVVVVRDRFQRLDVREYCLLEHKKRIQEESYWFFVVKRSWGYQEVSSPRDANVLETHLETYIYADAGPHPMDSNHLD